MTNSPAKPARQLAGYGPPDAILAMQRAAGNCATSGFLRRALESQVNPLGRQQYNLRKSDTSVAHDARPSDPPPMVHEAISSSGQPLDAQTRAFMQSRFANNFAHVRVHTGDKAAASASSVGASAYTLGSDIVFGSGKYAPHRASGRRLIAHEIAHVVQQSRPETPRVANEALLEQDANQAASNAMEGIGQTQVARASAPRISREPNNEDDKYCRLTRSSPGPTGTKVDAAIELFRRAGLHALKRPPENDRAMRLLETTEEYLRGIVTTQNIDRLFSGASKTHLSILAEGGLEAVQAMICSIRSGSSTLCGRWDRKFDQLQIARQPLLILSGEAGTEAANLPAAINKAYQDTLIIAGTIVAVLVSGGVVGAAVEAAGGVIASETAAQLIASTRIGTLVISNPAVAEQIFLFGAGTVIEIVAAGGIKEYLNQISTPEGAANKLFEILHLRLTMGSGGPGRNRTVDVPVEEVSTTPTKIRIRLQDAPGRPTNPGSHSTGGRAGAVNEPRGPVSPPVLDKKSGLGPKATTTKKADLTERHPNGSADRRSRMTVAGIDEKIAEVKRGQVDKREVAEDFLAEALPGGASRRTGGGSRQRRLGEPLSTGKITEDLDKIIEAGRRPEATAAEKANAERAKAIKRGFEDDARKLNDLARQRTEIERETR
jgi:hypothetical protein